MYFFLAFLTVATVGALLSARTLCGYNNISPWWKVLVFVLLWLMWSAPMILGLVRRKGWLEGPLYNTVAGVGYFLFGFAFILFALLLFRDVLWGLAYGFARWRGQASAAWSPVNLSVLTAANLVTLALAVLLSFYALYQGIKTPRITEVVIETPKIDREITLLQINDMHIDRSKPVRWFAEMIDLANAQQADLIVMPGDIVDDRVETIMPQLAELKRLKSRYGVYFAPGNHELYNGLAAIQRQIQEMNIVWLAGEGQQIAELPLYLAGIPDLPVLRDKAGYEHILDRASEHDYKILLAHNPINAAEYIERGFDLQLSAHTHGGQIFPFHLPVKYVNRYLAGLYELPGGKLYISRGAGYWGPPMRLLAPSDMTLIRLRPVAASRETATRPSFEILPANGAEQACIFDAKKV